MEVLEYRDPKSGIAIERPAEVIWEPQDKQAMMMARAEYEALYGGAAGGGKTDYLVIEALRQVDIPWYKGLILRRTYPQLKEIIDKAYHYYPRAYPAARYNKTEHRWRFPSGAKIDFGSMKSEEDKYRYQGLAYDFIGFDELTHFTASQYEYLKSHFNPRSPRGERRQTARGVPHRKRYFNPRSPRGERPDPQSVSRFPKNFNPRSPRGERRKPSPEPIVVLVFQSTLPSRGATNIPEALTRGMLISIHAPLAGSDSLRMKLSRIPQGNS